MTKCFKDAERSSTSRNEDNIQRVTPVRICTLQANCHWCFLRGNGERIEGNDEPNEAIHHDKAYLFRGQLLTDFKTFSKKTLLNKNNPDYVLHKEELPFALCSYS